MRVAPWLYDLFMESAERTKLGAMREAVVSRARGTVIEIGSGTGLNFPHYDAHARVVATDVDARMLERGRKRISESGARIILVAADAERLPFRDQAFDEGVVGLALCTIPDPSAAMRELSRVTRSGSAVHLLEHVRVDSRIGGLIQDWLTPLWRRVAGGCHLNRRTAEIVAANGFLLEEVRRHSGGVIAAIIARRKPQ